MKKEEKSKSSKYFDEEEFKKELGQQSESVLRIFEGYNKRKKEKEKAKKAKEEDREEER